jgi:DNA replication protein DnaC
MRQMVKGRLILDDIFDARAVQQQANDLCELISSHVQSKGRPGGVRGL